MVHVQKKVVLEAREELEEKEALLPEGTPLLSVSGVELPESAVGPALEFLEFCSAFYKVCVLFHIDSLYGSFFTSRYLRIVI